MKPKIESSDFLIEKKKNQDPPISMVNNLVFQYTPTLNYRMSKQTHEINRAYV